MKSSLKDIHSNYTATSYIKREVIRKAPMQDLPTIVFFFNDWPIRPSGANCGGGETATMSLAEAFAKRGYRTIACASLPDGETTVRGVEYWDFGSQYKLFSVLPRIAELGPYYAFAATLVHPFLLLQSDTNCKRRILINHSPGVNPSGLESRTVMHLVDHFVCVSEAQKQKVLSRGGVSDERTTIIRNGFRPDLFQYAGPESRDWNQLLYAGRLEPSKGIHFLLGAFTNLKRKFPALQLKVFGDQSCWPSLQEQIPQIQSSTPGLTFHGKVTQATIAQELQTAGCLVFPSISFESAGLSVLDAQASGCPVIASDIGGVKEYLIPECGLLVADPSPESLEQAIESLLLDPERMKQMSLSGDQLARFQTWDLVAEQLCELAEKPARVIAPAQKDSVAEKVMTIVKEDSSLYRTWFETGNTYQVLLDDHDRISSGVTLADERLFALVPKSVDDSIIHLWQGLRLDALGRKQEALESLHKSYQALAGQSWQPIFRLILLEAEMGLLHEASGHAQELLDAHPQFPMKIDLKRLITQVSDLGAR